MKVCIITSIVSINRLSISYRLCNQGFLAVKQTQGSVRSGQAEATTLLWVCFTAKKKNRRVHSLADLENCH